MVREIMALTIPQQIQQLIGDKKQILITFGKRASRDAIASAVALLLFLERQGKHAEIVCDGITVPPSLNFLKKIETIKPGFPHLQKFIVTIDITKTGLQELSYDVADEKLRIFITPKQGFLSQQDVKTTQTDFRYDLIFVLDTPDLEALGSLYDRNTELFYKTPVVNIDYHPDNEHFGQINVIELTAISTAEVLYDLMKQIGEAYISEEIATALLAGLIAASHSFKAPAVKPQTLAAAAKLMSLGANRERVVDQLYRTRTVSALKLWGVTLTHLSHDKEAGMVWSTITRDDFARTGASEFELYDMVEEILSTAPDAKIILLLHEHADAAETPVIHGLLKTPQRERALETLAAYQPKTENKQRISFTVTGKTLKETEEHILSLLRSGKTG